MKSGFWRDPDAIFPLLIFGLFSCIPGSLLGGYSVWSTGERSPLIILLGGAGGAALGVAATVLVVFAVWSVCRARVGWLQEIREVLPNYRPLTFKERLLRYLDFRRFPETKGGSSPWRS